jgi:uncharacterized protein
MNDQGITLTFHVIPASKRNQLVGYLADGSLKIKIKAKPIEGRANSEIINFLAGLFEIKKSEIDIISGQTSRNKIVRIHGINKITFEKKISGEIN